MPFCINRDSHDCQKKKRKLRAKWILLGPKTKTKTQLNLKQIKPHKLGIIHNNLRRSTLNMPAASSHSRLFFYLLCVASLLAVSKSDTGSTKNSYFMSYFYYLIVNFVNPFAMPIFYRFVNVCLT